MFTSKQGQALFNNICWVNRLNRLIIGYRKFEPEISNFSYLSILLLYLCEFIMMQILDSDKILNAQVLCLLQLPDYFFAKNLEAKHKKMQTRISRKRENRDYIALSF